MPLADFHVSPPTSSGHVRVQVNTFTAVEFSPAEQEQLLESLARIRGYVLVDKENRRELLAHINSGVPDNVHGATAGFKALAGAVATVLRSDVHVFEPSDEPYRHGGQRPACALCGNLESATIHRKEA